MSGSTISTKIRQGITLGSAAYPDPLTITSTGEIAPSDPGATAIFSYNIYQYYASIRNGGTVAAAIGTTGGAGAAGSSGSVGGAGGVGGSGVNVLGGSLINDGLITGGSGGEGGAGGRGYFGPGGRGGTGGTGGIGVDFQYRGSVTNSGTITGGTPGLPGIGGVGPDSEDGALGLFGTGGVGVLLGRGGTLTNAGVISGGTGFGTSGDAVYFGGESRLIFDPGASFNGAVVAKPSLGSALELASGASAGTLSGLGSQFIGFATVTIDAGASWTLASAAVDPVQTIADAGTLTNTGGLYGTTVTVDVGGSLTNPGTIAGSGLAVDLGDGALTNSGMITGSFFGFNGVDIANGTVTNRGTITGGAGYSDGNGGVGIVIESGGSLINYGAISGGAGGLSGGRGGYGIRIYQDTDASSLTNASGARITGGVIFQADGALTDAGYIAGGDGVDAVDFGFGSARLTLDPGASFSGDVVADASYPQYNVLELASAGSEGVLAGLGSSITGFGIIQFDARAAWLIEGNSLGLAAGQAIEDFAAGDTIELTGFAATGHTFGGAGLVLSNAGSSETIAIQGSFTSGEFTVTNNGSDSFVELCFLRGTHIRTDHGEVAVENLTIGDRVITRSGKVTPIEWIGVGKVLATRGRRNAATPVVVRKGALADNVPYRDLRVTKGHSLYIDGVLIPVELLVNHRSILWDDHAQEVSLFHIELEMHDVLLANGAPAESYRDDGNRWLFQNANSGWGLPPQGPCAPILTGGPIVDAVWRRLLQRDGPRASTPLTDDPDLHLMIDGKRVDAVQRGHGVHVFRLPSRPRSARVHSRAAAPQELGLARDPRMLGVAIRQIALADRVRQWALAASETTLAEGFHAYEPDNDIRWTDGDAVIPPELFAGMGGSALLMLQLSGATQYPDDGRAARVA